uniref:Uncharacterized protein n=1 Tax=Arion vulgaris TaxID=1028688 RepID=A0A0B6ZPD8_9EUPU
MGILRICTIPNPSQISSSTVRLGEIGDLLLDDGDTGEGDRDGRISRKGGSRYMLGRLF